MMHKQVPLVLVENHNDALQHVFRCIGQKHLPFTGSLMIHFDSHPDLSIPVSLNKELLSDKQHILESVDICSWIIPLMYNGHIEHVVWLKPYWSTQIKCGAYAFSIGKHKYSQKIKCTLPVEYFISELEYCDIEDLSDPVEVKLTVLQFSQLLTQTTSARFCEPSSKDENITNSCYEVPADTISKLQNIMEGYSHWILDIDLDSFATIDPFKKLLSSRQYEILTQIYSFDFTVCDSVHPNKEVLATVLQNREAQIGRNLKLLHDAKIGGRDKVGDSEDAVLVAELLGEGEADVDTLHEAGLCIPLPEHTPASREELISAISCACNIIHHITTQPPNIITVARSSWDEYCPQSLVDDIQNELVHRLKQIYDGLCQVEVINDYHHYHHVANIDNGHNKQE